MSKKINLLLTDDHSLVRAGFKLLVESDEEFKVVAEADDGISALEQVRAKNPDIIVLELALPKLNGFNTISQLTRRHQNTKIFVLTSATSPRVWQEALEFGVHGIATKSVSKKDLLIGLKTVANGEIYIDPAIAPKVEFKPEEDKSLLRKKGGLHKLSVREKQVTKLIAEGYKTKEIAEMLEISDRTVSKHRENLMTKLGATSPAEITHYAIDTGLTKVKLLEIE